MSGLLDAADIEALLVAAYAEGVRAELPVSEPQARARAEHGVRRLLRGLARRRLAIRLVEEKEAGGWQSES